MSTLQSSSLVLEGRTRRITYGMLLCEPGQRRGPRYRGQPEGSITFSRLVLRLSLLAIPFTSFCKERLKWATYTYELRGQAVGCEKRSRVHSMGQSFLVTLYPCPPLQKGLLRCRLSERFLSRQGTNRPVTCTSCFRSKGLTVTHVNGGTVHLD